MVSWREHYLTTIERRTADLPADTPLTARIVRVAEIRASLGVDATSWGKKSWARARREYLVRFGYVPRTAAGLAGTPLFEPMRSPLDIAREKGLSLQAGRATMLQSKREGTES